jgi:hypothetical protein
MIALTLAVSSQQVNPEPIALVRELQWLADDETILVAR